MTNDVKVAKDAGASLPAEVYSACTIPVQYYLVNNIQMGKFMDEVKADFKHDRMNTKRAISADIASTARVQKQNDRIIAACERELQRKDLSEERRAEIFRDMSKAGESTYNESKASREFQREQLEHAHKLHFKLIGISLLIATGLISNAVFKNAFER